MAQNSKQPVLSEDEIPDLAETTDVSSPTEEEEEEVSHSAPTIKEEKIKNTDWAEYQDQGEEFNNLILEIERLKLAVDDIRKDINKINQLKPNIFKETPKTDRKPETTSNNLSSNNNTREGTITMSLNFNDLTGVIYGDKSKYGSVVGKGQQNISYIHNQYGVIVNVPKKNNPSNKIEFQGLTDIYDLSKGMGVVCAYLYYAYQQYDNN